MELTMLLKKVNKKTAEKTLNTYPNQKTLWSYYMQAIEPVSREIDKAFPEYHPMWIINSQTAMISGKKFYHLREYVMKITQEQCAAYLRVKPCLINAWENEKKPVPFMAFELLRLVYETANFRLSHRDWAGWFVNEVGRLVSPDVGNLSFSPGDLSGVNGVKQLARTYELENKQMKAEIEPLRAEINVLKQCLAFDELSDLLQYIKELESKINLTFERINSTHLANIIAKAQNTTRNGHEGFSVVTPNPSWNDLNPNG
jgi:transcriptional regulator with XRE-family HTH domain